MSEHYYTIQTLFGIYCDIPYDPQTSAMFPTNPKYPVAKNKREDLINQKKLLGERL